MNYTSLRLRLTGSALSGAVLLPALVSLAPAQTAPPPSPYDQPTGKDVQVLEAFVTTGSNIKRLDEEKSLPVTVITNDEIAARDSATPMDLLSAIPEITNIPANETSTNAVAARGDNANVALRGIGAANTLVVLNGRRMPFYPFNTSSVNVNVLPTFGVQQVEILRDGASAIYGSDAVAGVVNYVTRKHATGGEVSFRVGFTEHGGGSDIQGNLGYGTTFANGKGSIMLGATGYYRDAIYWRERAWSKSSDKTASARPPWNVAGSSYDGTTATGVFPSFTVTGSSTVRWFYPTDGVKTDTPSLTTVTLPHVLNADYNDYTVGQPQSSRESYYNRVEYELTPSIRAFGELSLYASRSRTTRQPITLNSSDSVVVLSADNPYNPYGTHFVSPTGAPNADGTQRITGTPATITINSLLLVDGGPENIKASDQMYRGLAGLGGKFGSSSWTWESAVMLGGLRATDFAVNSVRDSYLRAAALRTDATAWNPFGWTFKVANGAVVADKPYTNPQSVRDFYTTSANRYGHSRLASWDARVGGDVFSMWAGPWSVSGGVEWRYEYKEDHKDAYAGLNPVGSIGGDGQPLDPTNNDILVMSPKAAYAASRTIASTFAETVLPLASSKNQIPLAQSLELNASGRFERYSDFGSTTKPKFGVAWKPVSFLMVRGSINQGFRAPDLADLYQPSSFSVGSPPGTRDTVRNNFLTQTSVGLPADGQVLSKTYSLGNSKLQPETSSGRSVGVAVDVPKIKGLSFTIDYWEITQKSLITSVGRDASLDAQLLMAYTQQQLAAGVPIDQIDVGYRTSPTDTHFYAGDPNTLRSPVTAVDKATFAQANAKLPASGQLAPLGVWIGGISTSTNSAGHNFTNGFDYSVGYSLPRTPIGQFRLSTEWSEFLNKFTKTTPVSAKNDEIISLTTPKWRGSATLQWRLNGWSATVNAAYQGMIRSGATTTATNYAVLNNPSYIAVITNNGSTSYVEKGDSQLQLNGGVAYAFGRQANRLFRSTTLRLGVNDLLDSTPTKTSGAAGYSGTTGSSLWVGRAFTFTIDRTF